MLSVIALMTTSARANSPEQTVVSAAEILREQTTIPASRIPEALLAEAHGVAIIPDVFKIGFVAAFRDKGRLSPVLEQIPLHLILDDRAALWGAAAYAFAHRSALAA